MLAKIDLLRRQTAKNDISKTVCTEFTMYVRPPGNPGVPPIPIALFFQGTKKCGEGTCAPGPVRGLGLDINIDTNSLMFGNHGFFHLFHLGPWGFSQSVFVL